MLSHSGTRRLLRASEKYVIRDSLTGLGGWDGFVTGGCTGIDHFVGKTLFLLFPEHHHLVIVPANRSRVAAWWRAYNYHPTLTVHEMGGDTDYKARNQTIIDRSRFLIAYPDMPEHHRLSQGSGTWQTIRMARRAHHENIHVADPLVVPLSTMAA